MVHREIVFDDEDDDSVDDKKQGKGENYGEELESGEDIGKYGKDGCKMAGRHIKGEAGRIGNAKAGRGGDHSAGVDPEN